MQTAYIACIGDRFDAECQRVIDKLSVRHAYRFVAAAWTSPASGDYRAAWVVDKSAGSDLVIPWLNAGVPVLFPDEGLQLRELLGNPANGLSYMKAEDAEACLHALVLDERLRADLQANYLAARKSA